MANRYWVGGTGTWNATNTVNWSTASGGAGGASVPTAADAVFFTNLSSGTCTVGTGYTPQCLSISFSGHSGGFTGTGQTVQIAGTGTVFIGVTTNVMTGATFQITSTGSTAITVTPAAVTQARSSTFKFTGGTYALTLTAGNFGALDFTGYSGTLANTAISVYGNVTISSTMSLTAGTSALTFTGTGTKTFTTNGKLIDFPVTMNASGATLTLGSALTLGTTRTFNLTFGTLNLSNLTLSTGIFSSNTSNTRQITFGTGNITITCTTASAFAISMAIMTGLIWTGTSQINCAPSVSYTVDMGSVAAPAAGYDMNISFTGGSGAVTFSTSTNFTYVKALNFTGSNSSFSGSVNTYGNTTLASTANTSALNLVMLGISTISGTGTLSNLTINQAVGANTATLGSSTVTVTNLTNLVQGVFNLSSFIFNTGRFTAVGTSTRSVTFSGGGYIQATGSSNTIVQIAATGFTATGTLYIKATATATTGTRTINFTGFSTVSLPPSLSTSGASGIVLTVSPTITDTIAISGQINAVDTTGSYNSINLDGASIFGGLIYGTNTTPVTVTQGSATFVGNTVATINTNGKSAAPNFEFNNTAGSWSLSGAFSSSYSITVTAGTFNTNSFAVTVYSFSSNNSNTRSVTLGTSTITATGGTTAWNFATTTGLTFSGASSTIVFTPTLSFSVCTFAGGSLTYNILRFSGTTSTYIISGSNTFTTIQNTTQPSTVRFTSGTTTTVTNFTISGTLGNLVTLDTTSAGSQATLSKSSGAVSVSYVSIKDSNATGGATWTALTTNGNVNNGNNTGWNFGGAGSGNMFLMFR